MPHARVAVFLGDFPLLSETFVIQQLAGLLEAGHDVRIFAERRATGGMAHPEVARCRLMERATFAADRWAYRLADRIRRPHRLCTELRQAALRASDAQARDFDVILCHFGPVGLRACANPSLAHLQRRMATVLHGYDMSSYVREHGQGVYAPLIVASGLLLPVNRHFAGQLSAMGASERNIQVMPMGVDCSALAFTRKLSAKGCVEVLMVARLVEKKGAEYAFHALALIQQRRPDLSWRFTLVGDGPRRADLERLASNLGVEARTTFAGPLPSDKVREAMSEADVFVLPSVTAENGDEEGIPVALMEAMACGAAVVSTTHSGIPELVEHEVSGLLAPERDVEALALCLTRVIESFELRTRLCNKARERVEESFDHRTLTCRLSVMLDSLAAS